MHPYQAIQTRYIAATDTRYAQIRAKCAARSKGFPVYALPGSTMVEKHHAAVIRLADSLGWLGCVYTGHRSSHLVGGGLNAGKWDYTWVLVLT